MTRKSCSFLHSSVIKDKDADRQKQDQRQVKKTLDKQWKQGGTGSLRTRQWDKDSDRHRDFWVPTGS